MRKETAALFPRSKSKASTAGGWESGVSWERPLCVTMNQSCTARGQRHDIQRWVNVMNKTKPGTQLSCSLGCEPYDRDKSICTNIQRRPVCSTKLHDLQSLSYTEYPT